MSQTPPLSFDISPQKRARLEAIRRDKSPPRNTGIPRRDDQERIPLSFAQQRLWFLDQLAPSNPFYNVPIAIQITGALNQAALAAALDTLVDRHAILRTRFPEVDGQPVQQI